MTSWPTESKPIIWLKALSSEDLEFARELRNANKEYFFDQSEITSDMQMDFYGSMQADTQLHRFFVVIKNSTKIGTISIRFPGTSEEPAIIGNVLISSEERRNGYGEEAVRLAINSIYGAGRDKIYLEVMPGNSHAIEFYKKLGFVEYSLTMRMDRK